MKKNILLSIVFLTICLSSKGLAEDEKILFKIKPDDTVFIIMPDTVSEVSRSFMKIYDEYWNFSKKRYISTEERLLLAEPGNWFFGFSMRKHTYLRSDDKGSYPVTEVSLSLSLYTYEFEQNKKGDSLLECNSLYDISLHLKDYQYFRRMVPLENFSGPFYKLDTTRYDLYGKVKYWGPGILKNHIQKISMYAKAKYMPYSWDERNKSDNPNDLPNLKNHVLYIPFDCFSIHDTEKDIKKVLEDYPYECEGISTEDLNRKIVASEGKIYYLTCFFGVSDKSINIINSKTGQVIYRDFQDSSHKLKKKDLKKIVNRINGE